MAIETLEQINFVWNISQSIQNWITESYPCMLQNSIAWAFFEKQSEFNDFKTISITCWNENQRTRAETIPECDKLPRICLHPIHTRNTIGGGLGHPHMETNIYQHSPLRDYGLCQIEETLPPTSKPPPIKYWKITGSASRKLRKTRRRSIFQCFNFFFPPELTDSEKKLVFLISKSISGQVECSFDHTA